MVYCILLTTQLATPLHIAISVENYDAAKLLLDAIGGPVSFLCGKYTVRNWQIYSLVAQSSGSGSEGESCIICPGNSNLYGYGN